MSDSAFEFEVEVGTRLRDLDPMGHVNNSVYATYLEEGRERYFETVLDKGRLDRLNTVTVRQTIEYEQPIEAGHASVRLRVRVDDVGEQSLRMVYEVLAGDMLAATGETVQVVYDMEVGEPRTVPADWKERLERFERGLG